MSGDNGYRRPGFTTEELMVVFGFKSDTNTTKGTDPAFQKVALAFRYDAGKTLQLLAHWARNPAPWMVEQMRQWTVDADELDDLQRQRGNRLAMLRR